MHDMNIEGAEDRARQTRPYRSVARAAAAAATGERILDEAAARFLMQPYETVSLEEIAEGAGVAVRTVIRHFGSKDELYLAVMRHAGEEMLSQRTRAAVGDVQGAVQNVLQHYERWGDAVLLMIGQEHRVPAVERFTREGRRFHRRWVEQTFAPLFDGCDAGQRERRVLAVLAATDVYVWKLLRRDLGLGLDKTQRVIETLIGPAGQGGC